MTVKSFKYSSLLSSTSQDNLARIQSRKASNLSTVSTSAVSVFLDHKIQVVGLNIDYTQRYKEGLVEAFENQKIQHDELLAALREIKEDDKRNRKEYVTLKRHRKHIEEDISDDWKQNLETAYSMAIKNRVRIPRQLSRTERNYKKYVQEDFRVAVEAYYDAVKQTQEVTQVKKEVHCAVTKKWFASEAMKAAHLVPKSLQSDELSYLFGVGEIDLNDPRNGTLVFRILLPPTLQNHLVGQFLIWSVVKLSLDKC